MTTSTPRISDNSAFAHSHTEGTLNATTATKPNVRNIQISKTRRRNTERLSKNKTTNPKPTTADIPPLATICKLLNAISGVTANTPSESGTARCKSKPCNTFNTKPYTKSANTTPIGKALKSRHIFSSVKLFKTLFYPTVQAAEQK